MEFAHQAFEVVGLDPILWMREYDKGISDEFGLVEGRLLGLLTADIAALIGQVSLAFPPFRLRRRWSPANLRARARGHRLQAT